MDEVHPFSDTNAVDVLVRESGWIFTGGVDAAGTKNASRIWNFVSKFLIIDRFLKTLGLSVDRPGLSVPRRVASMDYFGTASKVNHLPTIYPPFNSLLSDSRRA